MRKTADKILASLSSQFAVLEPGARRLLAVSGGLDSMILLEAAYRLREPRVHVLHVNHALRGEESDGDESFVKNEAASRGFAFASVKLEWRGEKPSQDACRRRRENFFESQRRGGEKIFLAHHQGDQAETLFLRLLRGTGLDGLKGMAALTESKARPLLGFSQAEILAVAEEWGTEWREDSSNCSTKYERNWLRNEIFPQLEARRPGFASRLAALAGETRSSLPARRSAQVFSHGEHLRFALREALLKLNPPELKQLFSLGRGHTASLSALLSKGSGECSAPRLRFRLSQGILLIESGEKFSDRIVWEKGGGVLRAASSLGTWRFTAAEAGDRATLASGAGGKKRFQEARVPLFFRDSVPVLKLPKPEILVPGKTPEGVEFSPSALGLWWINSSLARDDRGRSALG